MIKGSLTLVTHWGHVEVFTSADASAQLLNDSYNIGAVLGFDPNFDIFTGQFNYLKNSGKFNNTLGSWSSLYSVAFFVYVIILKDHITLIMHCRH
jgi:hypothetical protein